MVALGGTATAMLLVDRDLSWYTSPDAGGVTFATGGNYSLGATIGQVDANVPFQMTGGNFTVNGGFWPGATGVEFCLGDIDQDDEIDFQDLLILLNGWGPCPALPTKCVADLDFDGEVDFQDLLILLSNWGCIPSNVPPPAFAGDSPEDVVSRAGVSHVAWNEFLDVLDQGDFESQDQWLCWMKQRLSTIDDYGVLYIDDTDCPGNDPMQSIGSNE